jgi:hypothetical protein
MAFSTNLSNFELSECQGFCQALVSGCVTNAFRILTNAVCEINKYRTKKLLLANNPQKKEINASALEAALDSPVPLDCNASTERPDWVGRR